METKEVGNELGRDTRMCGDPKALFPMRVTYQREMKVKAELDRLGIENFVPMRYKVVDGDTDNPHRELVPAINNLIFVRSTQELVSELKQKNEVLDPLRCKRVVVEIEGVASVAIAYVPAVLLKEIG